jgi:hypothetical protein
MYRTPKKTDRKLDFTQYRQMYSDVRRMDNINFDPTVFYVIEDTNGMYVSLTIPEVDEIPYDWQVLQVSATDPVVEGTSNLWMRGGTLLVGSVIHTLADMIYPNTPLILDTALCIVGYEYSFADKTFIHKNFGSTMSFDPNFIRQAFWELTSVDGGVHNITRRRHDILFPANFGEE